MQQQQREVGMHMVMLMQGAYLPHPPYLAHIIIGGPFSTTAEAALLLPLPLAHMVSNERKERVEL